MSAKQTKTFIRCFRLIIKLFSLFSLLLVQYLLLPNSAYSQTDSLSQILQSRIVQLQDTHSLFIDGNKIAALRLIPELYTNRNFSLTWKDRNKRNELIQIIQNIDNEGLNPADYFLQSLYKFNINENVLTDSEWVDFDILLTESLVRLAYHIRFGKVDPKSLDSNWNLNRSLENSDPAEIIQTVIDSDSIQTFMDRTVPRQPFYKQYKKALAQYRNIKTQGGWQTIPSGPTLKPGMDDSRIIQLKQRLKVTGDYSEIISEPANYYDSFFEEAVKNFQKRHGLKVDGVIGKNTLQAMNVSVDDRIDQIRVNLERGRWVFKEVQEDYFVVNIAGFQAFLVKDNKVIWDTRVVVGKPFRRTPVFKSEMKYMVFNPTWTIPPSILRNDILPKANKNPDYIREYGLDVLDREGNQVDPDSLDWSSFSARNFPYILRQPPGPKNALGRIKFIFPNTHFVYLHDTPHRELFDNPERTISSGCIRVENPIKLAELLLDDKEKWNQQRISEIIESNKTKSIYLPEPLTVLLLYWTVMIDQDGQVSFRKDVYGRDKKVLEALDGEFKISLPEGLPERYYN